MKTRCYCECGNEAEVKVWLQEIITAAHIPNLHRDIPNYFRDALMEEWDRLEVWQKEEYIERNQTYLKRLSEDARDYANTNISPAELSNLNGDDFADFDFFVGVHIPEKEISRRTPARANKIQKILQDLVDRFETQRQLEERFRSLE